MIKTKNIRQYRISPYSALTLRDKPEAEQTIQGKYFDDMAGMFLKRFVKLYGPEELSDEDRAKLRRYLDRVFDAKDAVTPREPKGGMYLRSVDR